MDDSVVSAIPGVLMHYSSWAQGLDDALERQAHALYDAVDVLAASQPDPQFLTITPADWVSNQIFNHALTDAQTDRWVGQVGQAFLQIATKGLPAGIVRADYQDFLNGQVTTAQADLAGLVGGDPTSSLPPLPPTDQREAWWKTLTADEQMAYLLYAPADVAYMATKEQLQAAGFKNLEDVYYRQALLEAGIDPSKWDPNAGLNANMIDINEKIYAFYQHIYDANPNITWAGLAKLVGGEVFGDLLSLDAWRQGLGAAGPISPLFGVGASELQFYETKFLQIQKAIFDDMVPHAVAYMHGGMDAIKALQNEGSIDPTSVRAWTLISRGDVKNGNLLLAQHEQVDIVSRYYNDMANHPITGGMMTATLSKDATSPVPGGTGFHQAQPNGNLANWRDRWNWVEQTLLPDYRKFLLRPDARQMIDEPLDQLAQNYSISPFSILPWA